MKVRVVFSNNEQGIKHLEMSYKMMAQIILNKSTNPEKNPELKSKEEKSTQGVIVS